jgi:hypothetical protein
VSTVPRAKVCGVAPTTAFWRNLRKRKKGSEHKRAVYKRFLYRGLTLLVNVAGFNARLN